MKTMLTFTSLALVGIMAVVSPARAQQTQGHRRHGGRGRVVHDAGQGADGGRPRRHAQGAWPVHRLCADRRGIRQAAGRARWTTC